MTLVANTDITYRKRDPGLAVLVLFTLMLFSMTGIHAQTRGGVKGNLKDAQSGEPLMYANVALKGTTTGTVTDDDGDYQLINVRPGKYTLIFSYLGYGDIEQEIEIRAGEALDTVIFENCTFYNITSRIIRDAGGTINYVRMNNNTMVNIGQMGITFGPTVMLEFKNNIAVNAGFLPKDDDDGWIVFSIDSVTIDSVTKVAPVVDMTNNTAYLDSAKLLPYLNDTTTFTPMMNPTLMAALIAAGDEDANWNMNIEFTDGTPFNDSMLIYYNDPAFDMANTPYWDIPDIPGVGEGGNGLYHLDVPYDYGYVHSKAFVAATDGMQLGDRNWMSDRGVMGLIDFEDPTDRSFWVPFANAGDAPENLAIVPNPDNSGINTSAGVMMYSVQAGADPWAGAFSDANGYMNFTQEMHHMEMMVYKDVISNCALKVEVGGTVTEVKVPNTVTNEWELLTFDFSANIGETLTRVIFFPDFPDTREAGSTAYVDNIQIVLSPVGVESSEGLTLRVYPNPASDHMIVQYQGMTHIVVRDLLGKSVKSIQLQGEDYTTIEVDDLSEGIYFITVGSEGSSITTKFLKK